MIVGDLAKKEISYCNSTEILTGRADGPEDGQTTFCFAIPAWVDCNNASCEPMNDHCNFSLFKGEGTKLVGFDDATSSWQWSLKGEAHKVWFITVPNCERIMACPEGISDPSCKGFFDFVDNFSRSCCTVESIDVKYA